MGIIWALKTSDSLATVGRATVGPCTVAVAVALPLRAPEGGGRNEPAGKLTVRLDDREDVMFIWVLSGYLWRLFARLYLG